jgi:hypothetical protein
LVRHGDVEQGAERHANSPQAHAVLHKVDLHVHARAQTVCLRARLRDKRHLGLSIYTRDRDRW